MREALRQHHISFKNAFAGLFWAIRTQPNFRVHLICAVAAIWLGNYLGITSTEMMIIFFTILLGLAGELINTAIEAVTDLVTKEVRQEAKIAKDVAAGMMLTIAMGAVGIAGYIFIPYISPLLPLF